MVSYYYFYGLLRDFCKRAFALVLCVYKCANVCVCVYRLLRLSMLMSFNFEMQISLGQRRIVGFDLSARLELELIRIKFTNEPPICISYQIVSYAISVPRHRYSHLFATPNSTSPEMSGDPLRFYFHLNWIL